MKNNNLKLRCRWCIKDNLFNVSCREKQYESQSFNSKINTVDLLNA